MAFFNFFIFFFKIYFYLTSRKKKAVSLALFALFSNLLVNNFNDFRYQTKFDKKGHKYTHDLLTGKKWKVLNRI